MRCQSGHHAPTSYTAGVSTTDDHREAPTGPSERRGLLVMAAPPPGTRVSDMSDDEHHAWAKSIVDVMATADRAEAEES